MSTRYDMIQKLKDLKRHEFDTDRVSDLERVAFSHDVRDGQTIGGGEVMTAMSSLNANERQAGKVLAAVENKMERRSDYRGPMKKERSAIRVHSTSG